MTKVLSVGQCGADEPQVRRLIEGVVTGARVVQAHSAAEALTIVKQQVFSLVLVNRVFDATGESGLDFISHVKAIRPEQSVALVSNYADAQQDAISRGALPGFGKSSLRDATTVALIKRYLSAPVGSDEGSQV